MTILVVYGSQPSFPPTDQQPGAVRYQIGNLWVDATGTAPTQADVDAFFNPPTGPIDLATLNAALAEPGSVVRALALLMLQRINAIDAAINALNTKTALAGNNLPIFTQAQLVTALQALMR